MADRPPLLLHLSSKPSTHLPSPSAMGVPRDAAAALGAGATSLGAGATLLASPVPPPPSPPPLSSPPGLAATLQAGARTHLGATAAGHERWPNPDRIRHSRPSRGLRHLRVAPARALEPLLSAIGVGGAISMGHGASALPGPTSLAVRMTASSANLLLQQLRNASAKSSATSAPHLHCAVASVGCRIAALATTAPVPPRHASSAWRVSRCAGLRDDSFSAWTSHCRRWTFGPGATTAAVGATLTSALAEAQGVCTRALVVGMLSFAVPSLPAALVALPAVGAAGHSAGMEVPSTPPLPLCQASTSSFANVAAGFARVVDEAKCSTLTTSDQQHLASGAHPTSDAHPPSDVPAPFPAASSHIAAAASAVGPSGVAEVAVSIVRGGGVVSTCLHLVLPLPVCPSHPSATHG